MHNNSHVLTGVVESVSWSLDVDCIRNFICRNKVPVTVCLCVCVYMCVCACVCVHACAYAYVCVYAHVHVCVL